MKLSPDDRREARHTADRFSRTQAPTADLFAERDDRGNLAAGYAAELEAGCLHEEDAARRRGGIAYELHHVGEIDAELERRRRANAHGYQDRATAVNDLPERFAAMRDIDCAPVMRALTGQPGRRAGQDMLHYCFLHEDEGTPSLRTYQPGKGWWCFVCNVGRDAVELVAQFKNITRVDALVFLERGELHTRRTA